jgi:hypothetical protein
MGLNMAPSIALHTVVYDDFTGHHLDDRWTQLAGPGYGRFKTSMCFEPTAETQVGEGTLDLFVPGFTSKQRGGQVSDNGSQLVSRSAFSTRGGIAVFSVDMAATRIGDAPADYRDGFASFMLVDIESGWSFQVCCNGHTTFAIHDALRDAFGSDSHQPAKIADTPTHAADIVYHSRRHDIIVDSIYTSIEWWADGQLSCRVKDLAIPPCVHIALGLAALRPAQPPPSEVRRQPSGLSVSFGPVSVPTTAIPT